MVVCSELCGTSKAQAHSSIHKMIRVLCSHLKKFVKFPQNEQLRRIELEFRQKKGFPGVIGCVDGTHIAVNVPASDTRETFRNRKGYLSLNCQMICGPKGEIFDVISSWPGSTHDGRMWRESKVSNQVRCLSDEFHVLGDSAYPLQMNLMSPYKNPQNRSESNKLFYIIHVKNNLGRFNYKHSATRMAIEKAYGVIKRRFPLLKFGLRFKKVVDSANCIAAAVVLHNICLLHDDDLNNFDEENEPAGDDEPDEEIFEEDSTEAKAKRNYIMNTL